MRSSTPRGKRLVEMGRKPLSFAPIWRAVCEKPCSGTCLRAAERTASVVLEKGGSKTWTPYGSRRLDYNYPLMNLKLPVNHLRKG